MSPEICPNCGSDVPRNSRACPDCGACEETGWSDAAAADGLDLPDEEFNYDEFVEREFGGDSVKPRGQKWFWWIVALVTLLLMLALMFHR